MRMAVAIIAASASCACAFAFTAGAVGSPRSVGCTAGVHTVGGATVRTFCGPAHATVKAGGKTFHFASGICAISRGIFTVNIGSITLGHVKPKFAYLGIDAQPPRAGTHRNQIASWQEPGKSYSILSATVVLNGGLKSGSFSGTLLTGGGKATGSFSCS